MGAAIRTCFTRELQRSYLAHCDGCKARVCTSGFMCKVNTSQFGIIHLKEFLNLCV